MHSWGGCPTWQLSRFLLGLSPRFDVGERHFALELHAGAALPACSGTVPARVGPAVGVSWTRVSASQLQLTLTVDATPIWILGWPAPTSAGGWVQLCVGSHTSIVASETVEARP